MDPFSTAVIGWSFSAAGWLISPILSRFLNRCFDALDKSRKETLSAKLDILQTTLRPQLLILADAAEQSQHRPALENWLQKLRSAFYEAEYALGLVEYRRLEKEVNSCFPSASKFSFKKFKETFGGELSPEKDLSRSLKKLKKIVDEAMEIVTLLNLPSGSVGGDNSIWRSMEPYRIKTSSSGSTVIGREEDRDRIVKLLREDFPASSSNAKCFSVIGIWGIGGSGKTTLAQYVYEHEKEAKFFDCILWAHVSKKFDVYAIMKNILESLSEEACPDFGSLEPLQSKLKAKLRGHKFFLVLDDVWCDKGVDEPEIDELFAPLRAGQKGSKILVTTRIEDAAKAMGAMNPIPLQELDEKQFFTLFMSNALGDAQFSDKYEENRFNLIGKDIAAKLHRSPLAAKIVAGPLRRRLNLDFWSSMLNKKLLNSTMGVLFLSYQHLSPPLQRCFAFCSLFPKGHVFTHDYLANLWIAEGFVNTGDGNEHIVDIANEYVSALISSSFFQVDASSVIRRCFMHDLMHDLAQYVSEGECFRYEGGKEIEVPPKIRHVYVVGNMVEELKEKICKSEDLVTIIGERWNINSPFFKSKKLRVVQIEGSITGDLSLASDLRNLRYLQANAIPESFNVLYQLRVLETSQIPYIGKLVSLHNLRNFHVKKEKGFELKQLEHLTKLYGSLSIYGLENVRSKEEAYGAKLFEKKGLNILNYIWNNENRDIPRDDDAEILDGLCPASQIKDLLIMGYGGRRFPGWISESSSNIPCLNHL